MRSSVRFGRGRAVARTGVQVSSAPAAEAGAILTAQRESRRHEGELLPDHTPYVNSGDWCGQQVHVRIFRGVRVGAEQRPDLSLQGIREIPETAPAGPPNAATHGRLPEELLVASLLQSAMDLDRTIQVQAQTFPGWILRGDLSYGLNRSPVQVPQIDHQHSREF